MKDCSQDIQDYHDAKVKLTKRQTKDLEDKRRVNRARVTDGLKANNEPAPIDFVTQGSFAMGTIIQEPENAYDLDEGIIFTRESLVGSGGVDKTPLDARKMVQNAVDNGAFKTPPEVKKHCVRIVYGDGTQVDMPVYRRQDEVLSPVMELASVHWTKSHPEGVNEWFRVTQGGRPLLRCLVRLLKSFCKNRPSYSLPSGFVLTVLGAECYRGNSPRLDENVRRTIEAIHDRLACNRMVRHPVVGEWLIEHRDDPKATRLLELLGTAVEDFLVLDLPNCTRAQALKVWKKVFWTNYFDTAIMQAENKEKAKTAEEADRRHGGPKPWCCDEPAQLILDRLCWEHIQRDG